MVGPEGGEESRRDAMYRNGITNFIGINKETPRNIGHKVSANPVSIQRGFNLPRIMKIYWV